MQRRNLLKGMAAFLAAPRLLSRLSARAATAPGFARVRPGDPAWPSATSWSKLREAVGGHLIAVEQPFAACVVDGKSAGCADILANVRNPFYIGDQPWGTQISGWLDAWTPATSVYAVKARSTEDVRAAVNFARDHNLRLVVKGGGHSYQGTSNAPDSLLIWTRAMNAVTLHDAFTPGGGEGAFAPVPAVTAEAGALWIDLYHAVTTQAGRYVQGGGCADVGVAGLIQSGGFGSFSKAFGTASAWLLEAEIVTADGMARTVNAYSEPDLFWALKGGGGGSWGVVTKVTLRTHDLPAFLGGAWGNIKASSDDAFRRLVAHFFEFYAETLFNPHWGEQIRLGPDNTLEVFMVCQGLDNAQAKSVWAPFFEWVMASPQNFTLDEKHGAGAKSAQNFWTVAGNPNMIADSRPGAPDYHGWWRGDVDQVSAFLVGYESVWLPASLLQESERETLVDALFAASRHKKVELQFNKGLARAPDEALAAVRETAIHPTVIEAFALAIIADGADPRAAGDVAEARNRAREVDRAAVELRRVAPESGSYVSESNYFNPSWQDAYWGKNHPRLAEIKAKYDPEGLFFVHHGVGSEAWSADGFVRR